MEITALYLHLPFCRAKCSYCDFNSYAGQDALYADYASALAREIEQAGPAALDTVYLGGGTPSVLPFPLIARILAAVNRSFVVQPEAEITMEANPGTVDRAFLSQLRGLGINRLSLGVQSLDAEELRLLGRIHSAQDALDAFRSARRAGFDNINLDLIFGLPGQRLATW
jgi:oxygen-independent coproporphyrinogen-3 oxidase